MQALIIERPEGCGLPRILGKSNWRRKDAESPEVEWHICLGAALETLGFTLWIIHRRSEKRLCKDLLSKKQFIAIRQGGEGTIINPKKPPANDSETGPKIQIPTQIAFQGMFAG